MVHGRRARGKGGVTAVVKKPTLMHTSRKILCGGARKRKRATQISNSSLTPLKPCVQQLFSAGIVSSMTLELKKGGISTHPHTCHIHAFSSY